MSDRETVVARARRMRRNLGTRCAIAFVLLRLVARLPVTGTWRLHPRGVLTPLLVRSSTSDVEVFGQIFSGDEYAPVGELPDVAVVLDGGANVGYSAAYFLSKYPRATVISVEPDPENVALLRRNLEPYGPRSVVIEAALWSSRVDLVITTGFRDARHWSRQVQPVDGTAAPVVPGVSIRDVMTRTGVEHLSILKLDIEGSEAELFRDGYSDWIDAVDTFVVELHDDAAFGPARERFFAALGGSRRTFTQSGELTIARARQTKELAPTARSQHRSLATTASSSGRARLGDRGSPCRWRRWSSP
jgi:FkbM family methyltransferase